MATLAKLLVEVGVKLDGALRVEQQIRGLRTAAQGFGSGMTGALRSVGASARSIVADLGGLRNIVAGIGAAGVAAGVGLFKFVESQAEAIGNLKDLSATVGLGVEELQRLQFAASQSGVSSDTLSTALKKFNANMLDMASGGGKAAREALAQIGLSFEELKPLTRTQQLGLIGDRLQFVGDTAKRSALAAEIFGMKAGPQLSSLLAEGSAGITALAESARGVFSEQQVAEAEEFGDTVAEVQGEVMALVRGLAMELLPTVREGVISFRDWIDSNREFIAQDMHGVVVTLTGAIDQTVVAFERGKDAVDILTQSYRLYADSMNFHAIPGIQSFESEVVGLLNPLAGLVQGINEVTNAMIRLGLTSAEMKSGLDTSGLERAARQAGDIARQHAAPPPAWQGPRQENAGPARSRRTRGASGGAGRGGGDPIGALGDTLRWPVSNALVGLGRGVSDFVSPANAASIRSSLRSMNGTGPADTRPAVTVNMRTYNVRADIKVTTSDPLAASRDMQRELRRAIVQADEATPEPALR